MPLLVYKSSAGSGKTTTLVNEYLKITLNDPQIFRNVLAITFTNKAANEMKTRILDSLQILASEESVQDKSLIKLIEQLKMTEAGVKQKAKILLSLILHRYEEFAVSTIDSFVHRIVRTFATDVKLPQNFEVVIENADIVPEIIEMLYEKVGSDEALTNLLLNFVMTQVEDEKGYDPTRILDEFVNKQLGEESFKYVKKIQHLDMVDFLNIINKIKTLVSEKKEKIKEIASNALNLIHENGLTSNSFYQGSKGIYSYFKKLDDFKDDESLLPGVYPEQTINNDNWYGGKTGNSDKSMIDVIKVDLAEMYGETEKMVLDYLLFKMIYKKIYSLALIKEINSLFTNYTLQTQRVHISEFNKKISDEIAGQPVPFIYERLGRKYRYFLIDEFQDTSMLQWNNLLPLIEESLSNGNFNMLVGDSKQAIYRFRNGEVELFANLPKIYKNDGSLEMQSRQRLLESAFREVPLIENFRSRQVIVDFNNAFFHSVKSALSKKIQDIYLNHVQKVTDKEGKKGGYVSVELIDALSSGEYREKRLLYIKQNVEKLLDAGKRQEDICVLSGSNANAAEVAAFLVENGFQVISPESLLLTNSVTVRLTISFLNLLLDSKQELFLAEFVYNLSVIKQERSELHKVFVGIKELKYHGLQEILQHFSIKINVEELLNRPIYEMAEMFVRAIRQNNKPDIFLQNFLDFIYENQDSVSGRLDKFLEKWEKKKNSVSVITPSDEDAIRVMTIHKAKGLKFNSVIVDVTGKNNLTGKSEYWTKLHLDEVKELEVGLFPMTKALENIGMAAVYQEEKDRTQLDFINMIYVAFTRTVDSLFIIARMNGKKNNEYAKWLIDYLISTPDWDEQKTFYEFGTLSALENKSVDRNKGKEELTSFISTDWKGLVSIAHTDDPDWDLMGSNKAILFGNLIHRMLSLIHHETDIEKVIQANIRAGFLNLEEGNKIKQSLNAIVNHPQLKEYFGEHVFGKNETEIIDKEGKLFRTDRVVISGENLCIIDYKTGVKFDKYTDQLNHYAAVFSELGYQNIKKILVYANDTVELVEI